MNIFGIGLPEMGLIMIVALLVFGPKKLPEIGRSMGKALKGFQEASKEFETEFKKEAERIEQTVAEPMKATLEKPRAIAAEATSTEATIVETSPVETSPAETSPNEPVSTESTETAAEREGETPAA
jgi:sec-independent protein translocase protein TatA